MIDVHLQNTKRVALISPEDSDLLDFDWFECIGESSDERYIMHDNVYLSEVIRNRMGLTGKRPGGNCTRWRLAERK
jgi:hypothetical protein